MVFFLVLKELDKDLIRIKSGFVRNTHRIGSKNGSNEVKIDMVCSKIYVPQKHRGQHSMTNRIEMVRPSTTPYLNKMISTKLWQKSDKKNQIMADSGSIDWKKYMNLPGRDHEGLHMKTESLIDRKKEGAQNGKVGLKSKRKKTIGSLDGWSADAEESRDKTFFDL